jgi:prolipoprotein diacylglyceryltransferase
MIISFCVLLSGCLIIKILAPCSKRYVLGIIGDKLILTYGIFQAAGHVIALAAFLMLIPSGFTLFFLFFVSFICYPASALTARSICGITDYWVTFKEHPWTFITKAEKYSAFGGLVGGIGSYLIGVFFFDFPIGYWFLDAFCFALLIGEFFSRLGCHINGCCYGRLIKQDNKQWALSVIYENPLQKAVWHGNLKGRAIYAAPLYMCLTNLILICVLIFVAQETSPQSGFIGALGCLLFPYCRLINEYLRTDRQGVGKLFTYVILCIIFMIGYAVLLQSLRLWASSSFTFSPGNVVDPIVGIILAFDYAIIFVIYAVAVQFHRQDVCPAVKTGS